jgi:hypothetical protein
MHSDLSCSRSPPSAPNCQTIPVRNANSHLPGTVWFRETVNPGADAARSKVVMHTNQTIIEALLIGIRSTDSRVREQATEEVTDVHQGMSDEEVNRLAGAIVSARLAETDSICQESQLNALTTLKAFHSLPIETLLPLRRLRRHATLGATAGYLDELLQDNEARDQLAEATPQVIAPKDFVILLGELRIQLAEFCRLKEEARPKSTRWNVECRLYSNGPMVEIWAEFDVSSGVAGVYWMDLAPNADDTWRISRSISRNGQETILEFEDINELRFAEMLPAARRSLAILLASPIPDLSGVA